MAECETEKFRHAVAKLNVPEQQRLVTRKNILKLLVSIGLVLMAVCLLVFGLPGTAVKHEQVHIAFGTNEREMLITWTTLYNVIDQSHVLYGDNFHNIQNASQVNFNNFYVHRALLTDLEPDCKYCYKVGSNVTGYSKEFCFQTLKSGSDWLPSFAIYGDLGVENAVSLPYLEKDANANMYNAIFHLGDMAYDLHDRQDQQGHDFMNEIESLASRVAYMVMPGNHERADNFSHYDARFSMLGDRNDPQPDRPLQERINNHFWSVNIGPVHVIAYSSEFYDFAEQYGWEQIERQYAFLEKDLHKANANRDRQPWIIVMAHKSLYVSDSPNQQYGMNVHRERQRLGVHMHNDESRPLRYGLEDLFYQQHVDAQFYGHEHMYSRMWPLYNLTVANGTINADNVYEGARAPVYIVSGASGSNLFPTRHNKFTLPHVAVRNYDFGYTRLRVVSRLHVVLEQFTMKNGIIDRVDLRKPSSNEQWFQ